MPDFEYGPVEILVVGFPGERPDAATFEAIGDLVEAGDIRLLDALVVSKSEAGDLDIVEIEDLGDEIDVTEIELEANGLVGEEDANDLSDVIPPGSSAALLAIELVWAKKLASRFAESGGVLLQSERIPAPVVNAIMAEAEEAEAAATE